MLIKNIGRLVTMEQGPGREGPMGVMKDVCLKIGNGVIKNITPSPLRRSSGQARPFPGGRGGNGRVINACGGVVIPGLIDCHTHLVHAGSRAEEFAMRARGASYEEIAKAGGGIMSTVRATRAASEGELLRSATRRARELASHGVTTVEVKSGYGLDLETELKMLRVVKRLNKELPLEFVPTFLAHMVPKGEDPSEYVRYLVRSVIPAVAKGRLARFCDVFVEKLAFTAAEAAEIFKAGLKYGLKPKVHADQLSSCGGAALASRIKAVSADHLEKISTKDIRPLAKAGVVAVMIPSSTFFIGGGYAPARRLIDAGVPVAVSTDYNPGTSPVLNLWMAAALAITQMKLTPFEAYAGITINAARALGMHGTHGSIKVGKVADVVILNARSEFEPLYGFDGPFVKSVIKKGEVLC